jgi:hypothetical protein
MITNTRIKRIIIIFIQWLLIVLRQNQDIIRKIDVLLDNIVETSDSLSVNRIIQALQWGWRGWFWLHANPLSLLAVSGDSLNSRQEIWWINLSITSRYHLPDYLRIIAIDQLINFGMWINLQTVIGHGIISGNILANCHDSRWCKQVMDSYPDLYIFFKEEAAGRSKDVVKTTTYYTKILMWNKVTPQLGWIS